MQIQVVVSGWRGKMRILRALADSSISQVRTLPLRSYHYRSEQRTGESFSDAATFYRNGVGDCDDATVAQAARLQSPSAAVYGADLIGAPLEGRSVAAWPMLCSYRQPAGAKRMHTLLYLPGQNLICDPSLLLFREFLAARSSAWWRPTTAQRAAIHRQQRQYHG